MNMYFNEKIPRNQNFELGKTTYKFKVNVDKLLLYSVSVCWIKLPHFAEQGN